MQGSPDDFLSGLFAGNLLFNRSPQRLYAIHLKWWRHSPDHNFGHSESL